MTTHPSPPRKSKEPYRLPVQTQVDPTAPRRIWTDSLIAELTSGTMTDQRIRQMLASTDSRGMNALVYAALRASKQTGDLTALLALLEPPEQAEQTQLGQVVGLLEQIAESQIRIERRLAVVESRLAVTLAP